MLFVSTGRCGTTRISEILREKLPEDTFCTVHQMRFSRLANILGNIMFTFKDAPGLRSRLYKWIISKYDKGCCFISTDPLTSMILPDDLVESNNVCIVHIVREADSFARSMFSFSRSRVMSFIAHNFVPFWQPGRWPIENLLSRNALDKYREISLIKNDFFRERYSRNGHYLIVTVDELFTTDLLQSIVNDWFDTNISISRQELEKRSNVSGKIVHDKERAPRRKPEGRP